MYLFKVQSFYHLILWKSVTFWLFAYIFWLFKKSFFIWLFSLVSVRIQIDIATMNHYALIYLFSTLTALPLISNLLKLHFWFINLIVRLTILLWILYVIEINYHFDTVLFLQPSFFLYFWEYLLIYCIFCHIHSTAVKNIQPQSLTRSTCLWILKWFN